MSTCSSSRCRATGHCVLPSNIKTYLGLHVKRPIFLSDFNQIWILSTYFRMSPLSNFMKIRPKGTRVRTCTQTDRHYQSTACAHNYGKAPENEKKKRQNGRRNNKSATKQTKKKEELQVNPLTAELNPIRHLLALVGAHHILHVSSVRVNIRNISWSFSVHIPSVHHNRMNWNCRTFNLPARLSKSRIISIHSCKC